MSKWTEMLLNHLNLETDCAKTTVKTVKTSQDTADNMQTKRQVDSFDGFGGEFNGALFERTGDAETVVERAAIMEYEGELPRDRVNRLASEVYDRQRQRYETANPSGNPLLVEELYRDYIQNWKPTEDNPVPATPPNTKNNAGLWQEWWKHVEDNS